MPESEFKQEVLPQRSKFVTILAWIAIVFHGFQTIMVLMQTVVFVPLSSMGLISQATADPEFLKMPKFVQWMFLHMREWIFIMFIICLINLISSIGLLRRQNWARIVFILMLFLGIIWNVLPVIFINAMMPTFNMPTAEPGLPNMALFFMMIRIFMAVMAIGTTVLFAWIIKKLTSSQVKQEFGRS